MGIFAFILFFILGFALVNRFANTLSIIEKIGFSFPIGLGLVTVLMFLLDISKVGITIAPILLGVIILIILFGYPLFKTTRLYWIDSFKLLNIKYSFGWFFLIGFIIYLLYGITSKGLYWPPAEHDSLTGYDLQAKMIANEGTFVTSQFDYPYNSTYDLARFIYPPLSSAGFALAYIFGFDNSKITVILLFYSLLISFYGLIRKSINDTWALLFTFFMMITPEMFSHASLSLTNLPNTVYTSISVICLYYWLISNDKSYFIISLSCMFLSNWSRSDSIVFVIATLAVILFFNLKNIQWKNIIIYGVISIIPFIVWGLFIKMNIGANSSDFFVKTLFWDSQKMSEILSKCMVIVLGNGVYYGITFFVFVAIAGLNVVDIFQTRNPVAMFIFIAWMGYTLLYYQIDYNFAGSIDAYINASYKRGMFNFVPLCWFFIGTSPFSIKWLGKADMFFNKN
ncbi:MAG: hypothetical protein SFY32_03820 [Bacteroidota bacterium]|nr:hypothetical protein [Bacteroidota bacterium]